MRNDTSGNRGALPLIASLAFLLLHPVLPLGTCAAAILWSEGKGPQPRLDFQTIIVRPSAREGKARVTAFFAFRVPECTGAVPRLMLFLPVDGFPEAVRVQAMSLSGFDHSYTHADDLEGAFYRRVRAEQTGKACLFTSIAATGGPPAWLLLSPHWPPMGPALTAVVPPPAEAPLRLPTVERVRVISSHDMPARLPEGMNPALRRALQQSRKGYVIAAELVPVHASPAEMGRPADTGVRISYVAPTRVGTNGAVFRLALANTSGADPPALSRVYAAAPWNRHVDVHLADAFRTQAPPQRLANDALAAFGYSEEFRRRSAQATSAIHVGSIRTADSGETTRIVAASRDLGDDMVVVFRRSATGVMRVALLAAGAVLHSLLWPVTGLLYLAGVWYAVRAYLWMTRLPQPESLLRRAALIAALGPVLTPWFMLKYVSPAGPPDGDDSGALGSLSMPTYECVARLVLWALLICGNWAVIVSLGGIACRLRFG